MKSPKVSNISIIHVHRIQQVLDQLYPDPPIPLNSVNDFTFLIAVVLSAQTTDGKVNQVTKELFELASTPNQLGKLNVEVVQRIIQPVGLAPTKAKNIVKLSQILVDKFQSIVPNTYEDLESLPGVGHKTASVIMSQIFHEPAFAVDTHVHRLALRWNLSKELKNVNKVQEDLCQLFPKETWNKLHLQMIYFGREYCTAKNHMNSNCPICSWIHLKDKVKTFESIELNQFTPQKRAKGIVYYSERESELSQSPHLSPHKLLVPVLPLNSNQSTGTCIHKVKGKELDFNEKHMIDNNIQVQVGQVKRKRRKLV